jgi:two-component system phosphate regulon sensor histidine kinase PhoR
VANVSHELRTPVASVRSAAETLRRAIETQPEAASEFVEIIERNAERLHQLIEDLLDLSRIESREFKLDIQSVELADVVERVLSIFRAPAEAKGVRLRSALGAGPVRVRADPRAVEQVLTNLVENAVKYCPAGTQVTVVARQAGSSVRVSVEDTGPGIEARHLPRIFERFYRADPGRSRELGGTGLGLSIVKHLVEAMDGQVSVDSTPGKGSRFSFTVQPG